MRRINVFGEGTLLGKLLDDTVPQIGSRITLWDQTKRYSTFEVTEVDQDYDSISQDQEVGSTETYIPGKVDIVVRRVKRD